jgi:carboxymethylenebutenolidase
MIMRRTADPRRIRRFAAGWLALLCAGCTEPPRLADQQAAPPAVTPDTVEFASGPLRLRGLVYRPEGTGPHPAMLFLHGSGDDYGPQMAEVGSLYARNGYLLFVPFRRGQGLSAGRGVAIAERLGREARANGPEARMRLMAELLATEQMDDVLAALAYLKGMPGVDSTRIAVGGNSFGGILSVFSAARAPGIRAAVASAPAALTWARAPELRDGLREAARQARVSIFFFQAENDRDLSPTRELAAIMTQAGKPHVLKIYPPFGSTAEEGHSFGYRGGATYGPDVFAFLARHLGAAPGPAEG